MAKRKEQVVVLKYDVDKSAVDDVKRINGQIQQNFEDAAKAIKRGGVAGVQEFKRLKNETRGLEGELRDINKAFKDAGRNAPDFVEKTTDQIKILNKELAKGSQGVRDFDDEFSQASQRVALLGDVETGARTIGGGLGRVGLGGAEQGIAAISEIPASLEAIGRLKPALAGVPDAISSLATSLGPTGIGLGAAALVGVGAFALLSTALGDSAKRAKELQELQKAQAEAFADINAALRAEDLEAAGNIVNQTIEDRLKVLDKIARAEEQLAEAQQGGSLGRITLAIDTLREFQDELDPLNIALREQSDTLADYGFSLTDATNATKESTEAETDRSAVILQQAELTRTTSLQQASLLQQSTEQLDARTESIENERAAIQLAIGELEANAEQTDKVTEAIASYNDQLGRLSTEQEFINSQALRSAELRGQDAKQQARLAALIERRMDKQKEAAKAQEADFEARAKLEEDFSKDLVALSEKTADASEKALANLQSKLSDLNKGSQRDFEKAGRDRGRKELESRIKAQQAEVDSFTDHTNKLRDIQQSAFEREEDNQQTRNFKSIFNDRRNDRRSIQAEQKDFARSAKQRNIENARARDERLQAFNAERQERLIKFSQSIADTRTRFAQEQADAMQAARNTINLRRQQYTQQLTDLQQSGNMELRMRRNIINSETGMISQLEQFAAAAFGRVSNFGGGFSQFGGGGASSNQSTTNNSTSVLSNIVVNARPNQGVSELAQNTQNAIKALL